MRDEADGVRVVVASDRVRHQRRDPGADAVGDAGQQHDDGEGEPHRGQRKRPQAGDEPRVRQVVCVHGERAGQHRERHAKQRTPNAFPDQDGHGRLLHVAWPHSGHTPVTLPVRSYPQF